MLYKSTLNQSQAVNLAQAVIRSRPSDGGLYLPDHFPVIPAAFFMNFADMDFADIAYVLGNSLFGDDLPAADIKRVVDQAFSFQVPVVKLSDSLFSIELFHGPTLAFKDFGARFMARMLEQMHLSRQGTHKKLHVLIATTGNTGAAVANGFRGIEGAEVYVLFPKGLGASRQEAQFTTLGKNVHAFEVQGSIDDCQAMVAQAFSDADLRNRVALTSANSVNVLRLLPQIFYYFYALARIKASVGHDTPVTVAVPAGNLGNLTAAIASRRMGLKIDRIIACENSNNYLSDFLSSGNDNIHRAKPTLAPAADKGHPTNISRLLSLCGNNAAVLRREVEPYSFSDADIIRAVNECYDRFGYTIDPHTALAYNGIARCLRPGETGLMLATAHPAKSLTAMNAITGRPMELPLQLTRFMGGEDRRVRIQPNYSILRKAILEND